MQQSSICFKIFRLTIASAVSNNHGNVAQIGTVVQLPLKVENESQILENFDFQVCRFEYFLTVEFSNEVG